MKLFCITILLFFSLIFQAQSQTDKVKAQKLYEEGLKLLDQSQFKEASVKISEAKQADPKTVDESFVEGYIFYKRKEYDDAISAFDTDIKSGKAKPDAYKLLGNCYELKNNKPKAASVYKAGLKAFPKSGVLLMELGITEMFNKNYNKAIEYFERGIKAEPDFAPNYYWAAKLFNQTPEKVWVLMYGETFMNLERNTDRTIDMGILLYEAYKKAFTEKSDTAKHLALTRNWTNTKQKSGTLIKPKMKLSFDEVFTETMSGSKAQKEFNLGILANYRNNFLTDWFNTEQNKQFPNQLFTYLKTIKDQGKFELYNYWLFQEGDQPTMARWIGNNDVKFNEFLKWFSDNPLKVQKEDKLYRGQYW